MDNYMQVYSDTGYPIAIILETTFYYKIVLKTHNYEEKCVFQNKFMLECVGYLDRKFDGKWSFRNIKLDNQNEAVSYYFSQEILRLKYGN